MRYLILSILLMFQLGGCVEQKIKDTPKFPVKEPTFVEGYPTPIDPVLVQKKKRPSPIPPKILINGEHSTLVYTCRAAHCDVLRDAVEGFISPEGAVQSVPSLNKLLIKDTTVLIPGLLKLMESLDQPYPQLLIEARIVEITLESDEQFEISHLLSHVEGGGARFLQDSNATLGTPGSSASDEGANLSFRTISSRFELDTFLRQLASDSKVRILSSPNLIVGVNYQANLNTGEEVPIQSVSLSNGISNTTTTFKNVGIKLRVKPTQITSDTASLEISPEVSTIVRFTDPGPSGVSNPVVAVRNVRTSLKVKDGEIVTIGGLLRSEDLYNERKVPGLGDIPLVGDLFKSTRKEKLRTALVFFLRMNILEETTPNSIRFHRPGNMLERLDDEVEDLLDPKSTTGQQSISPKKKSRNYLKNGKMNLINATYPAPGNRFAPLEPEVIDMSIGKSEEEDELPEEIIKDEIEEEIEEEKEEVKKEGEDKKAEVKEEVKSEEATKESETSEKKEDSKKE